MRLAAVLVEGTGTINTSGGLDADQTTGAVPRSPAGPIEVQAFVQDLFSSGCTTPTKCTTTPISGKPVVKPLPDNLPRIEIVGVRVATSEGCGFECSNTGSLTTPDVSITLSPLPTTVQNVVVEARTTGVPLGTVLRFRAVGADGSVSEKSGSVVAVNSCSGIPGVCETLSNLNPGVPYQIVVTPDTAFALARSGDGPLPLGEMIFRAGGAPGIVSEPRPQGNGPSLEQWARAFGVESGAPKKVAQMRGMVTEAQRRMKEEVRSQESGVRRKQGVRVGE